MTVNNCWKISTDQFIIDWDVKFDFSTAPGLKKQQYLPLRVSWAPPALPWCSPACRPTSPAPRPGGRGRRRRRGSRGVYPAPGWSRSGWRWRRPQTGPPRGTWCLRGERGDCETWYTKLTVQVDSGVGLRLAPEEERDTCGERGNSETWYTKPTVQVDGGVGLRLAPGEERDTCGGRGVTVRHDTPN